MSKLAKNSFLYLAATLFLQGSKFFLLPLYTHLVSPEEYGVVYLIGTLDSFLAMLFSLSVRGAVSRFYFDNKDPEALKEMYSSIVMFIFYFATVSYLIVIAFVKPLAAFMDIPNYIYLLFGLVGSYVTVFYPIVLALLYVQQKGKVISLITVYAGLFSIFMHLILVINMQDKIMAFMICTLLNGFSQLGIFIVFSKKYLTIKPKFENIKEYVVYSLHSVPGDISTWLITFADRIMISKIKGHTDTGLYSIGYKLGQFPSILFHSINKAYVPNIYEKYSNFNEKNRQQSIKLANYLFALFTGIIFIILVFSKEVILLLDKRYSDSLMIMFVILFSYLLSGYKIIFHNPTNYNKKFVKYKSSIWIIAALVNISLNFLLIPKYSLYGAAVATFITYLLSFISITILANKAIKISYPIKKYIIILLSSFIYLLCFMLDTSILIIGFKTIMTVFYILFLIKVSEFPLNELSILLYKNIRSKYGKNYPNK